MFRRAVWWRVSLLGVGHTPHAKTTRMSVDTAGVGQLGDTVSEKATPRRPEHRATCSRRVAPLTGRKRGGPRHRPGFGMEAMGARSNPCTPSSLAGVAALYSRLKAAKRGVTTPRPARRKSQPVLETILRILQEADGPLHARDILARAEEILGQPVSWSSMKDRLSIYSRGERPRFHRARRGWYKREPGSECA